MHRHRGRMLLAASLSLLAPGVAYAHTGRAPSPHDLWTAWTFAPIVITALGLSVAGFAIGLRNIWSRAGRGRGISRRRACAFAGGLAVLALALLSPIDALGSALFSVHMTQHLLLIAVASPLLVLGEPAFVALWAFPPTARRRLARAWRRATALRAAWRSLSMPIVAWTLHVVALWLWHMPRLYDAALRSESVHIIEHLTFMVSAMLFWWVALDRRRLSPGAAVLYLFCAALQSTLLGALLTLARHPWYAAHQTTTVVWGLTPLEDQQLAGLIMWIPGGVVYLVALLPRFVMLLSSHQRSGARSATISVSAAPRTT